jgi:hypothetical protein
MNRQTELSHRGRLIFGGLFILAGLPIVLVGLGILRPDPRSIHAPLWVIACAGFAFMAAGTSVALGAAGNSERDGSLAPDAPLLLRLAQYGLGLLVVAGLASIGTWIAFAPGERKFKSTISALGMSHSGGGGEWIGRLIFGLGAVLCWLMLVAFARQGWRKLFPRADARRG